MHVLEYSNSERKGTGYNADGCDHSAKFNVQHVLCEESKFIEKLPCNLMRLGIPDVGPNATVCDLAFRA